MFFSGFSNGRTITSCVAWKVASLVSFTFRVAGMGVEMWMCVNYSNAQKMRLYCCFILMHAKCSQYLLLWVCFGLTIRMHCRCFNSKTFWFAQVDSESLTLLYFSFVACLQSWINRHIVMIWKKKKTLCVYAQNRDNSTTNWPLK